MTTEPRDGLAGYWWTLRDGQGRETAPVLVLELLPGGVLLRAAIDYRRERAYSFMPYDELIRCQIRPADEPASERELRETAQIRRSLAPDPAATVPISTRCQLGSHDSCHFAVAAEGCGCECHRREVGRDE